MSWLLLILLINGDYVVVGDYFSIEQCEAASTIATEDAVQMPEAIGVACRRADTLPPQSGWHPHVHPRKTDGNDQH